jgi:hypothetical protein
MELSKEEGLLVSFVHGQMLLNIFSSASMHSEVWVAAGATAQVSWEMCLLPPC